MIDQLPGTVSVSRTIAESDVYLFAGITGDLSPQHVDAEYMRGTPIGERIIHGSYLLGLMSAASAAWCTAAEFQALSYGYDRVRFLRPIRIGDTVTASFTTESEVPEKGQLLARLEARNQDGELAVVATHILKRLEAEGS